MKTVRVTEQALRDLIMNAELMSTGMHNEELIQRLCNTLWVDMGEEPNDAIVATDLGLNELNFGHVSATVVHEGNVAYASFGA